MKWTMIDNGEWSSLLLLPIFLLTGFSAWIGLRGTILTAYVTVILVLSLGWIHNRDMERLRTKLTWDGLVTEEYGEIAVFQCPDVRYVFNVERDGVFTATERASWAAHEMAYHEGKNNRCEQ